MNLTIRARLTLLYALVLGASFFVFFLICDQGFLRSINTTVDDESRNNLEAVERVIGAAAPSGTEHVRAELAELSKLWANGAIFQVADSRGQWIFRSPRFLSGDNLFDARTSPQGFLTTNLALFQYRIDQKTFKTSGQEFLIDAAVPTEPFDQALDRFRLIEKEFLPVLVLVASLLGYWLSGKALGPVNLIVESAKEIGIRNLNRRLSVPPARDELRRLTETVNAMLERIEASVAKTTQFTADASHDLRTPLALIRTNAELALRRDRTPGEYRETLERILSSSEETTQLIEQLLTLARADAGAAQMAFEPVNLDGVVARACRQIQILARAKGIGFAVETGGEAGLGIVLGDPSALERLFLAVLDNAVKYTPAGGQIRVTARAHGLQAVVSINDSGIGISESELPRIFDRFYRADQARSREYRGSGLGLAIARWIAELHEGSIAAESEWGVGSVFTIALPVARGLTTATTLVEETRAARVLAT